MDYGEAVPEMPAGGGWEGGPGREIPTSKLPPLEGLKLATTGVLHFNASLVKRRVKGKVAGPCS